MPDILRKPRSETRQRTELVAVRFTPQERAVLAEAARRAGKGHATLLREAFLNDGPLRAHEDLLASIWLYVPWHWVTSQLTTPQKEMWADAVEASSARLNAGTEETTTADRWWRDA